MSYMIFLPLNMNKTLKYYKLLMMLFCFAIFSSGCAALDNNKNDPHTDKKIHTKWTISRLSGYKQQYTAFTPVKDYDVIYATGKSGMIYKIDPINGNVIDSLNAGNKLTGGLAVSGNTIFANTINAKLIAINKITHKILWQSDLPTIALDAPITANNFVAVKTNDAQILVFDIDTGKKIWVYNSNPPNLTLYNNHSMTIVNNELLLSGFPDGKLVMFNLNVGNIIWEQSLKNNNLDSNEKLRDVTTVPIVKDDKLYVANYLGNVYCIDLIRGSILWSKNLEGPISNISLDNDDLYLSANNSKSLYALSQSSGRLVWKKSFDKEISNITNWNDYLLVTDIKGYAHLIYASTGKVIEDTKIPQSGAINSIMIPNAGVLFQGQNGEVSLIDIN